VKQKLLDRLRPRSERTATFIWLGAAAAVLIAAMLVPLAFRTSPAGEAPTEALTLEERTLMFADYWNRGAEDGGYTVEKPDPVPRKMRETCETVMRTLIARSIDDQGLSDLTPTGSEYTIVSDGAGRELHLCRMWLEKRGDWQNWLDVCMDAESGEIYYFYLSRECLTNRKNYTIERMDAAQIAELLATENGWSLRYVADEDGAAAAVFSTPGGTLCFEISCRIYDALIDVRLACR
jgi:hypothetical protein